MTTTWKVPALSKEWVGGITVTLDGVAVTTYEVAVIPRQSDPIATDWLPPEPLGGKLGITIGPGSEVGALDKGTYRLWARFTSNPEVPVLDDVGIIQIT